MRWGLLGASRILHRALLPSLIEAGQDVRALAARDPGRAAALAAEWGVPAGCGYGELLERVDVDAVYVSVVNDAHAHWTVRALEAGKHVLCEKPLAMCPAEVEAVAAAAARTGRHVMEAFVYGFHPQVEDLLAALRDGAVGQVVAVEATFSNLLADAGDFRWRAEHGGGALLDLGTYCVSLIRDVMGCEPGRVHGMAVPRGGVDAAFAGVLAFGDALASFQCSFLGARAQGCRIVGTESTAEIAVPFSSRGRALGTAINGRARDYAPCNPYAAMVSHFVRAAAGAEAPRHGPGEALAQARVLDALMRSAAGEVSPPRPDPST